MQLTQKACPVRGWKAPGAQLEQDEAPGAALAEPAAQRRHEELFTAPMVLLNLPVGHGVQETALVAPVAALYVPAAQLVQTAAPLSLNVPAGHVAHEEGALGKVPGGHDVTVTQDAAPAGL